MIEDYDHILKFVINGESNVGKSCILRRYCDQTYNPNESLAIGVEFRTKIIDIDKKKVKLQIWDLVGQERFKSFVPCYYRGAHAILLVFDLTDLSSFINLNKTIKIIKNTPSNINSKIFLIGNKCDLVNRQVEQNDIDKFTKENDIIYFKSSAKENINIEIIFITIAKDIVNSITGSNIINLNQNKEFREKCC